MLASIALTVVDEWYEDRYIVVYDISEPGEIKECEVLDLTCTHAYFKGGIPFITFGWKGMEKY